MPSRRGCAFCGVPEAAVASPPGQRRNLSGDASLSLSEPMARLGLLLAMALVAMAALFAQLPLASAAPCVTSLLPIADAASDATALTAPSAAAEAQALEAKVGLLAAVATVLARPRPAAEAEAEWAAAAAAQPRPAAARLPGACSRARVLAARSSLCSCTGAPLDSAERMHAGLPPAAEAAPGALPAARCAQQRASLASRQPCFALRGLPRAQLRCF